MQVNGDSLPEPDETFFVYLSREHWAGVTIGHGDGTIVDDEPHISIGDVTVTEGNTGTRAASFAVTLSAASTGPVTLNFYNFPDPSGAVQSAARSWRDRPGRRKADAVAAEVPR